MRSSERTRSRLQPYIVPLILFLVALLPRVLALGHFITVDEPAWINRSARFLLALLSNNIADTMDPRMLDGGGPGIVTMWVGSLGLLLRYIAGSEFGSGGLVPFVQHYLQPVADPGILPTARFTTGILASAAVPALYLGFKDWLGKPIALLGALFVAFDPFYMAHSRVLHHDALVTIFMALSLMWALTALWHRYSHVRMALSGVMFTLALLSKLMGGFLVPFYVLLFVLAYFWSPVFGTVERGHARRRLLTAACIWAAGAAAAFVAASPGMWVDPPALFEALFLRGMDMAEKGHVQYFLGAVSDDPGILFYPAVLLFRTTPLSLLGLLLAIPALKDRDLQRRDFVRLAFLFIVLFTVLLSLTPKKQDRYLLPIFPWVDFLAAAGWFLLIRALSRVRNRVLTTVRVQYLLPVMLVVLQLGFLLGDFPYYFSSYNPLLGGIRTAARVLLVGWGEGLDEAGRYLDQKPEAERLVISAVPAIAIRPYFSGSVMDFYDGHSHLWADYIVTYVSQFQRDFPSETLLEQFGNLELEHVVTRHGLPYAYIYRGIRFAPYEVPAAPRPTNLEFGGLFRLTGFEDKSLPASPGAFQASLYWESMAETETDYTWSLRLRDEAGHQWAQTDVRPMGGALPTNLWRPGALVISDGQTLNLPAGMPPGSYALHLQVYALEDMSILPVADGTGRSTGTMAYLGTVDLPGTTHSVRPEALDMEQKVGKTMAPDIRLLGFDLPGKEVSPGENLPVTLYWEAVGDIGRSYPVRLVLVNSAGDSVYQHQADPHSGAYPTDRWTEGENIQDRQDLPIPADMDGGSYHVRVSLAGQDGEQPVSPEIDLGEVVIKGRPHYFEVPDAIRYPQQADFGPDIRLLGFDLQPAAVRAGREAELTLFWQAMEPVEDNYQVFVHVLDSNLTIQGQHDSIPGQGTLATDTWLAGEVISDVHPIQLGPGTPGGDYRIEIGLYRPDDGQRLMVSEPGIAGTQDHILLELPIHVQ